MKKNSIQWIKFRNHKDGKLPHICTSIWAFSFSLNDIMERKSDLGALEYIEYIESCAVIRSSDPAELAYEIALENNMASFHDSFFWAVAEGEEVRLLTLDQKMYEK